MFRVAECSTHLNLIHLYDFGQEFIIVSMKPIETILKIFFFFLCLYVVAKYPEAAVMMLEWAFSKIVDLLSVGVNYIADYVGTI